MEGKLRQIAVERGKPVSDETLEQIGEIIACPDCSEKVKFSNMSLHMITLCQGRSEICPKCQEYFPFMLLKEHLSLCQGQV